MRKTQYPSVFVDVIVQRDEWSCRSEPDVAEDFICKRVGTKTKELTVAELDPRLGWLEAFIATERHLDYTRASREVGVSASNVERSVERLQWWLHRVLIMSGVPLERHQPECSEFLEIAKQILRLFDRATADQSSNNSSSTFKLAKSKRSMLRLSDFETILAIKEACSFQRAAGRLQCDVATLRLRMTKIVKVVGYDIFEGHSTVSPTKRGAALIECVKQIVALLVGYRAIIPDDYNPTTARLNSARRRMGRRRDQLDAYVASALQSPQKIDRERAKQAQKVVGAWDSVEAMLRTELAPLQSPVPDIDVSDIDL